MLASERSFSCRKVSEPQISNSCRICLWEGRKGSLCAHAGRCFQSREHAQDHTASSAMGLGSPKWNVQRCYLALKPWSELRSPPLPLALVQCFAWLWVISSLSWQETQNWAGSSLSPKQRECLGWHLSNLFHLRHVTEPMNISRTEAGLHSQRRRKEKPSWRNTFTETMV